VAFNISFACALCHAAPERVEGMFNLAPAC
jgi:hypothetical protein